MPLPLGWFFAASPSQALTRQLSQRESQGPAGKFLPLPLGEVSPQVTERASPLKNLSVASGASSPTKGRQEDRCVSLTFAGDSRIMKSQRKIVFQTFGLTNKQKAPSVLRIPKGLPVCQGLVFAGLEQVIQPLADVIADHTCRNGQYKGKNRVHFGSPPLQISSGKSGSYRIP